MALAHTPDAFLARTASTAWNTHFSWCGWRRIDVDRGQYTILTYLGNAVIGGGFQFTASPTRQLVVFRFASFADLLAGAGPTLAVGTWYFLGITTIEADIPNNVELYYAAEGDASLTQVTASYPGQYQYTRHGIGWRDGADGADGAYRLHGSWAYDKTWQDTTLTPTEMLAEFNSTVPVKTSGLWSFWPGDITGTDLADARPLTATAGTGTIADTDPPALDGPPVPCVLAASAVTTDATIYSSASVAPHSGSMVVMDILGRDSVAVGSAAIAGDCISGVSAVTALANAWPGVQQFRLTRYTATGTGIADTIDMDYTGIGSPPLTGAGWVIVTYPAGTELRQNATGEGTGTALSTAALSAFGADGVPYATWTAGVSTGGIVPEAGWAELFEGAFNSPSTLLETEWAGSPDTTPTATAGSSTPGWAGIASELGPVPAGGVVGALAETDALLAVQRSASKTTTTVAEADDLSAAQHTHAASLGAVGETDTVAAVAHQHAVTVGQLAEADSLIIAARSVSRSAGTLAETDALATATRSHNATLAALAETDSLAVSARSSSRQAAVLAETDALLAIEEASEVGTLAESDTLASVAHTTARVVAVLAETEVLNTANRSAVHTVGQITEADVLAEAAHAASRVLGLLSETDVLLPAGEVEEVGALSEADLLFTAGRSAARLTGVVGESDTLLSVGHVSSRTAGPLAEVDAFAAVGEEVLGRLSFVTRTRPLVSATTTAVPTVEMEVTT